MIEWYQRTYGTFLLPLNEFKNNGIEWTYKVTTFDAFTFDVEGMEDWG